MGSPETRGPELIIQHTGQVFPLTQETISIGRAGDNTIILADPEVSAHHASISWQAATNNYLIQDLGSTNGTFVNERPVKQPQHLRHGDVIRAGNTIIDLRLGPAMEEAKAARARPLPPPPYDEEPQGGSTNPLLIGLIVVLLVGITLACIILAGTILFTGSGGAPEVAIQSPAPDSQIVAGSQIILQAAARGAKDITLLELTIDGALVATVASSDAKGQSSLTVSKAWTFTAFGEQEISAVAHTASGKSSRPESIEVIVVASGAEVGATATPTLEPDQPTNTPTPTGEPPTPTATPEPGETIVPLPPEIEYFQANPASITTGGCTTLQWGTVTGATEAEIEPDVGGVGTPGSTTVCPAETTTYILSAKGPGGETKASTVVTVTGAVADLTIDSIAFDPNPAVQSEGNEVKITIRNAGAGAAGAFHWEWRAGTDARFDGRLQGLEPGETTVITVRWTPSAAYARLDTVARVDTDNEVPESDKGNNEFWASLQVLEAAGGTKAVTLQSEATLDGYRGNDGRGSSSRDILVGNSELSEAVGEVVWRGFMSFDLSDIPSGASIESVELRFYQVKVGGDPYTKLGSLVLDQVDYGSLLDESAFAAPAIHSAVLGRQTAPRAWYVFNSTLFDEWLEQVLAAGGNRLQLRLRWEQETDGDGLEDYAAMESGDNYFGTDNAPELIVTYTW
jgi:hypothetical protein